jgi:hypothetical protein
MATRHRAFALPEATLASIERGAAEAGATAYPVFDREGRITEMAIWKDGRWIGSVQAGRAWSSIADRWWPTKGPEHAVMKALQGTHFRAFRGQRFALQAA